MVNLFHKRFSEKPSEGYDNFVLGTLLHLARPWLSHSMNSWLQGVHTIPARAELLFFKDNNISITMYIKI